MQVESLALRRTSASWLIVGLMATSLFINYIDRGNLATGAALITADLRLDATHYGAVLAAFYFAYTLCHIPAGALADRFGGKAVLAVGAALWSISTLLTGFVTGFAGLVVLRMMLGMGESVAFTTTSKLIAANVPPARMGLANGILGFGYLVGPAVGTLLGGLLMERFGWRPVFVLFGAVSLLWLVPWAAVRVRESTGDSSATNLPQVPLGTILRQRALWGAAIGHFAGNWNWYFVLGYLPMYLEKARGFSTAEMAAVLSSAYLVNALAALFGGWLIDRAIASGRSASLACKLPLALHHVAGLVTMLLMPVLPIGGCIAALFVYEIIMGISSPAYYIVPQIFAGPRAAARWVGVQNMVGNFPGVIGSLFAGILIDASGGQYTTAFALAAVVNLAGPVGWLFILPKIRPVKWEG